jgi:hypothetical protein
MDTLLACSLCGHTGHDVRSKVVEAPDDATVMVAGLEVPERYRMEPRCLDRDACLERQPAGELAS